eukprot:gene43359-53000_t
MMNDDFVNFEDLTDFADFAPQLSDNHVKFRAVSAVASPFGLLSSSSHDVHKISSFSNTLSTHTGKLVIEHESPRAPSKPSFVSKQHFYAKNNDFSALRRDIGDCLQSAHGYDCLYVESEKMWACKHVSGTIVSELHVSVYFDRSSDDHIVEVKKMKGMAQASALLHVLHSRLLCDSPSSSVAPKKRGLCMEAPPLSPKCSAEQCAQEDYVQDVTCISNMLKTGLYESKLLAVKMLLDLSTKQSEYITLPKCVQTVLSCLCTLISEEDAEGAHMDGGEDIRLLAVLALRNLLSLASYRDELVKAHSGVVECLLSFLFCSTCPLPSSQSVCVALRRTAALCLVHASSSRHTEQLARAVENVFGGKSSFESHSQQLPMGELKDMVTEIVNRIYGDVSEAELKFTLPVP